MVYFRYDPYRGPEVQLRFSFLVRLSSGLRWIPAVQQSHADQLLGCVLLNVVFRVEKR